jgi:DNA-binding GntR family transcriptional regulator
VAARLKVSRVPVREALRELESSGVVVSRKHSGVFVRQMGLQEVRDLYALRALLDGYAGRCAASLAALPRQALVKRLDGATANMNSALLKADAQLYYTENLRFHWTIIEATGNAQLAETYRGIVQKLHISRLTNLAGDGGRKASVSEHEAIVQALRNGDAAHAEILMARHVESALRRLTDKHQPETSP